MMNLNLHLGGRPLLCVIEGQPVSHTDFCGMLWGWLWWDWAARCWGMLCQLVLAGEGNTDSTMAVLGLVCVAFVPT